MAYKELYTHPEYTPVEVSTDAGMSAVLTDEKNINKSFIFTGTTGTYTNGNLYVPESVTIDTVKEVTNYVI